MHGESEKRCFDIVIQSVFTINPFNKKLPNEVSEEDFLKERVLYQQSGVVEKFFGLSEVDMIKIERVLQDAMPNTNISKFPDFVSESGFVEHFYVTSSMTNRKGSFLKKEEAIFMEKVEKEDEQFKNEMNENPSFGEVKAMHRTFSFPKHSYKYFMKSFINIWNKHMDSYEKYQGIKGISSFMIKYQDMALRMRKDFGDVTSLYGISVPNIRAIKDGENCE